MAAKKKQFQCAPEVVDAFSRMVAAVPGVAMKGAAAPYTSLNGNMYAAVSKMDRIGLRLSKTDQAAFLEMYDADLFEPFPGFVQKTYVAVPTEMHDDTRALRRWFRKSHAYAASLKPKPTTRKT